MPIFSLLRVIHIISRYQILTFPGGLDIPCRVHVIARLFTLFFCPINLFRKPKDSFGKRLTECLQSLGPIYVKFGQTLSTRPDLIGEETAAYLQLLQDKLPPFKTEMAKAILSKAFRKPLSELFKSFEDAPIAAASIAQVHRAELQSGERVAIKILRPGIHKKYASDLNLLYFLARIIMRLTRRAERLKPVEVVNLFRDTMRGELDLRLEAAAASELSDNLTGDTDVYVPKVFWQLACEDILVTEWVDGISIYDTEKLVGVGLDPAEISEKIAIMFFNQAYRDGFFHADLHPGNILVRPSGRIVLLDFGIMGRLADQDRFAIAEILQGFLTRNYKQVARVHLQAGYIPPGSDLNLFALRCRSICEPIVNLPIKDISIGRLLASLFKVTEEFGMETQSGLLLLQKTMVVVEGIGSSLNKELNMWQLARPWIKKWAAKNLSPEAKLLRFVKNFVGRVM